MALQNSNNEYTINNLPSKYKLGSIIKQLWLKSTDQSELSRNLPTHRGQTHNLNLKGRFYGLLEPLKLKLTCNIFRVELGPSSLTDTINTTRLMRVGPYRTNCLIKFDSLLLWVGRFCITLLNYYRQTSNGSRFHYKNYYSCLIISRRNYPYSYYRYIILIFELLIYSYE